MPDFEDYTLIALENALSGTLQTTIPGNGIIASTAQAQEGTSDNTIMTPLKVQQALAPIIFDFAPLNQAVPLTNNGVGWFLGKGSAVDDDFQWQQMIAGSGTVQTVSIVSANGLAGVSNADPSNPAITLSTTVTGLLKGNGTAISAAVSNTDFQAPISLTTVGTSGVATFNGTTLNIPNYADTDTGITQLTGDVTAGPGSGSQVATLANVVSASTQTKITYNAKGLVTAGAQAAASDLSNGTTGSGAIVLAASPTLTGTTTTGIIAMADNELQRPRIKDYGETVNALGSGGGGRTIDLELGNVVTATVSASTVTWTFSNPPTSGVAGSFTLILTNGGSQTVNWPASVDWPNSTAPTLTAAGVDILTFVTTDAGTTWFGFMAGKAMG